MSKFNERISRIRAKEATTENERQKTVGGLKEKGRHRVQVQLEVCKKVLTELGVKDLLDDFNESHLGGAGIVKAIDGHNPREHLEPNRNDYIDPNISESTPFVDTQAYAIISISAGSGGYKTYVFLAQADNIHKPKGADWAIRLDGRRQKVDNQSVSATSVKVQFGFPSLEDVEIEDISAVEGWISYPKERTMPEEVHFFGKDFSQVREDILDGVAVALNSLDKS